MRARILVLAIGGTLAIAAPQPSEAVAPPALTGKWHLRFKQLSRVHLQPPTSTRRTWIFRQVCDGGRCVKRLLFELAAGGYETFTVRRVAATKWRGVRRGVGVYCREEGRYVGRGVERVSIHITASEEIDGRRTATQLEAYYRARYSGDCAGSPRIASEVRQFRGSLVS